MSFPRVAAIVLRQWYLMKGSFSRILPNVTWVAVDIILWGFITKYLAAITASKFDFVPLLLGSVLIWDFFVRIMHGISMAFFEDIWSRNFLNLFSTPLSIAEYLTGLVCTSIATGTFGLAVMLLLAIGGFGLSFARYGLLIFPFFMILFLFGVALGISGIALVLRLGPASEWFIWPIPAILSPFVGVFYPIETLPQWMQLIARILPPSYVFENIRSIVSGGQASMQSLGISTVLAVIYILIACWIFTRVYRRAVRTGLIARYSAESVS
ncbi:MAG: ABC transporter permease [Deltaproteobacteria bacterium]|nr:ABC transporter permease [Deltaproteobacteria bacterium]